MRIPKKCYCGSVLEPMYRRSMSNSSYPLIPIGYYICPKCGCLQDKNGVRVHDPCAIGPLMLHIGVKT